jgi:two-component system sensor histidine kinase RegB
VAQGSGLVLVDKVLDLRLPLGLGMLVVAAGVFCNLFYKLISLLATPESLRLSDLDVVIFLGFDIIELSVLLYVTGGIINPFSLFLLAPVTVGASILSLVSLCQLCGFAITSILVLSVVHFPLPGYQPLPMPSAYQAATALALAISTCVIAGYVWGVSRDGRRTAQAFAAAQLALAREQRIGALGALAASAAHELGSPLATIAIVARELERALPPGSPHRDDALLLLQESARCRKILAELADDRDRDGGEPFRLLPATTLVSLAGQSKAVDGVEILYLQEGPAHDEPQVARSPAILHGLGNLIGNAAQFARSRVTVQTLWDRETLSVTVADDGPGFPAHLLSRLGEPYLSARPDPGGHMGLGIFIAQALLHSCGASVAFDNRSEGGALALILWPRANLARITTDGFMPETIATGGF